MKWLAISSALALLVAPLSSARAVGSWYTPVEVSQSRRSASGSLGYAYWSSDAIQTIECYAGWGWMGCTAKSVTGNVASCGSTDPAFLKAVTAISDDSYVSFQWDESGACTYLKVINSSRLEPR